MRLPIGLRVGAALALGFSAPQLAPAATAAPLRFEHLAVEDGLSDSWVHSILKDRQGFVWIGTTDGLNRYDGTEVTVYRHDPADPGSLPSSTVGSLFEDSKGRLWIGSWREGGLALYDRDQDRFRRYAWTDGGDGPDTLGGPRVSAMLEDERGRLWLATSNGLDRFDPETGTFAHFRRDERDPTSLHENWLNCLADDGHGGLFVGTLKGLTRFDRATGRFTRQALHVRSGAKGEDVEVKDLFLDAEERLWIGTFGEGLVSLDRDGRRRQYQARPGEARSLNDNLIQRVTGDRRGTVYVGTEHGGLNVLDVARDTFEQYSSDPEDDTTLRSDSIWALQLDDEGILWVGTFNGGVHMLSPLGQRFRHVRARRGGLDNPHVRAVLEARDGTLWVGTDGGGLNRLEPDARHPRYYRHSSDPGSIGSDAVLSLHEGRSGAIWAGTWLGGLNRLDPRTGRFRRYRHDPRDPSTIASDSVWAMIEQEGGELLLATHAGVDLFDPRTGRSRRFSSRYPGAGDRPCVSAATDRQGDFWLAVDWGVEHVARRTGRVTRFLVDPERPDRLGANTVNAIFVDSRGNVWLATEGGGLNCIEAGTRRWRRYTQAQGLISNNVASVLEDDLGNIWLGTSHGLSKLEAAVHLPSRPRFSSFDVRDGLHGQEFQPRAAFRRGNGELLLGGQQGLNIFCPREVIPNRRAPAVVFTGLRIFNRPVAIGTSGSPLTKQMSETRELTLSHAQSMVTFQFSALNYLVPHKHEYRARLEGFDEDWRSIGTQHSVTYTNLAPGEYVLRVHATNSDGVWGTAGAVLRVRVLPPFWRTRWFVSLAALSVLGVLLWGHRRREAAHEARARDLARKVEERTVDLQREIAEHRLTEQRLAEERDLRQAAMRRELLAEERARIARELHDSLAQDFAGVSLQLSAVAADLQPEASQVQASLELASAMLRHCQTEARHAVWDLRSPLGDSASLRQALEQALAVLQGSSVPVRIDVDPADARLPSPVQREVTRIAQEAVTNAVTHAAASLIQVRCAIDGGAGTLEIRDDGRGFEPETVSAPEGGQFGLLGMAERAGRISGTLDVDSRPGEGTRVRLSWPVSGTVSSRIDVAGS